MTDKPKRKICKLCEAAGKKRYSFPVSDKIKSNYQEHMKQHRGQHINYPRIVKGVKL